MRKLHIDIEAAPAKAYIWDLKTRYVPLDQIAEDGYILCFSYAWEGEEEIKAVARWDKGGERAMIKMAWKLLDEADVVIHYNGDNYDLPRLNTEFLKYRLGPPSPYHSVDLYKTVRGTFRVLSRSMKHMLHILGLESKLQHKGFDLWTGAMAGDTEDRETMVQYNLRDVEVMEALYMELRPWIRNMPNEALYMEPSDKLTCRCGSHNLRFKGYKYTKVSSYKQYHCKDCGTYMRARNAEHTGKNQRQDVLTW